ncbi:hypothetical protein GCM10011497_11690 [Elstera cyanobacteriorum]|nr:hypothetical protein GCM10011497_11690 [Elstera cyanobacteriorum]
MVSAAAVLVVPDVARAGLKFSGLPSEQKIKVLAWTVPAKSAAAIETDASVNVR